MANYGKPEYWEERYQRDPEPFDWYQSFQDLGHVITDKVPSTSRILNIGCGNSRNFSSRKHISLERRNV